MNEIIYTWTDFTQDTQAIVASIRSSFHHGPGGRPFTGIYAIPRGGLILGVALSHALELPMIMGGVDKHVLVVDDIADKGHTLEPYRKRGTGRWVVEWANEDSDAWDMTAYRGIPLDDAMRVAVDLQTRADKPAGRQYRCRDVDTDNEILAYLLT